MTRPIWERRIAVPSPGGGSGMILILLVLLMLITTTGMVDSVEIVDDGEHGVVVDYTGEIQRVVEPGTQFTIPIYEDVEMIPKVTTIKSDTDILTREGTRLTVQYRVRQTVTDSEVREFYRVYGSEDERAAISYAESCAHMSLRNTSALYDAEDLYSNPSLLQDGMETCDTNQFDLQVQEVELPLAYPARSAVSGE